MEVIIKNLAKKKLVGVHLKMSLVDNKTGELWEKFMQRHKEISNKLSADFLSIQCYPSPTLNTLNRLWNLKNGQL